ncbi:MAG: hypothetical protein PUC39_05085 [Lachnospiraceae bacterium]|nr:hypothetical protein [Lachnospiraceae bacterium]
MYSYSTMQWVLFFYVYCFLGWIWESGYVSARERKWTNRGFMHGPFLPIYGSGAIMILLATIPVKDNLLLIFFMGMIAATLLEYFTGAAMERLFHVRYWDYSNQFCNLNGHICLKCSLAWGGFSILMVRFIHVPVERCILWIPDTLEEIIAFVLTLVFVADFALSFREAMDFRNMLESLTENNEEIRRLVKRMEVISAFAEVDIEEFRENITTRLEESKERAIAAKQEAVQRFTEAKENAGEKKEMLRQKLERMRSSREYHRANSIMRRNSIVTTEKYREALEQLRERRK